MGNCSEQAGKLSTLRLVLALAAGQNLPQSLQEAAGYSRVPQGGGAEKLLCPLCPPLAPPLPHADPPALTQSAPYFTDTHSASSQSVPATDVELQRSLLILPVI